jgi:predicted PurR-regulated permease PerM
VPVVRPLRVPFQAGLPDTIAAGACAAEAHPNDSTMKHPHPSNSPALQDKAFLVLLLAVSIAFGWILLPFYGAVFWGIVLAIVFAPVYRWLLARLRRRPNLAAIVTLALIVLIVVLPLAFVAAALVREGTTMFQRIQSGEISFARYFQQIVAVLPAWVAGLLDRFGIADIGALQQKIAEGASQGSKALATRAFDIGQNALDFVVSFFVTLYLAFFLLRDGSRLSRKVWEAIPLDPESKRDFFAMFATVIRATVKGNILVAAFQGLLGGLAFWYLGVHGAVLWAVLMAFLSLLPAIGAAVVWVPVALYLLVTGDVWQGVGLIAWGTLVIGLVDNLLRPILVGKDIRMPDYLVLISTLGGMAIFGLNGFVIGPVIAAMFLAAWEIFVDARRDKRV